MYARLREMHARKETTKNGWTVIANDENNGEEITRKGMQEGV